MKASQLTQLARISLFSLLLFVSLFAFSKTTALAQTTENNPGSGNGQALEIAPPLLNLQVDPGQTLTTQIQLRNVTRGPLVVTSQVNDFVAAGEDGAPKILLEGTSDSPYSIQGWINPLPRRTLQPGDITQLPVTVSVPADASPGGHYGVVRFTAVPPELESTGVSLSASLGTLMLIRVSGDIKETLGLEEFSVSKNGTSGSLFTSTPVDFLARIKNTGNIHQQPVGKVDINDMFGNSVATVNINLPQNNILPDSVRRFKEPLNEGQLGNKILFGRYTAALSMPYGGDKELASSLTFWVLPWRIGLLAIAALVVGFFLLRYLIKRYNSYIVGKARRR